MDERGVRDANDYVDEEIVNICARTGISVPGDIAVLGVDDDEQICENTMLTLLGKRVLLYKFCCICCICCCRAFKVRQVGASKVRQL